jgi:hypothetical protein
MASLRCDIVCHAYIGETRCYIPSVDLSWNPTSQERDRGAFDCVNASLCSASTPLKMTNLYLSPLRPESFCTILDGRESLP